MSQDFDFSETARAWMAQDPDPETRAEVEALLAKKDADGLRDRFRTKLQFGTAGLRGLLGGGPNRMNRAVVIRATYGLCRWLASQVPDAKTRGLCVGFDGRRGSRTFAQDVAAVANAEGFRVMLFSEPLPTPVVGYAVLEENAAGGVVVTASHNPPDYNGYKVYWENGAQIIPPHDGGIANAIDGAPGATEIPTMAANVATERGLLTILGEDTESRYLDRARRLAIHSPPKTPISIAYTALHGVGHRFVKRALAENGFDSFHSAPSQQEPDGNFPTVEFPNPEEDGAMDAVLAVAKEQDCDLILANDPDADRLALAVKHDGAYVPLTGNEFGCLLAHYLLEETKNDRPLVVSSVVSSPWLGAIAAAQDARWEQTLTGFKWIANRSVELSKEGYTFVCGFEEAIGYSVSTLVRDKDGVSAAVLAADMTAHYKGQGKTLVDELTSMARRYGLFRSKQISKVRPGESGAEEIRTIMEGLRSNPPATLGSHQVTAWSDLSQGVRRDLQGKEEPLAFPSSNVLLYDIEGGHRVMVRPSGTEPKIKFYVDAQVRVGEDESIESARDRCDTVVEALGQAISSR